MIQSYQAAQQNTVLLDLSTYVLISLDTVNYPTLYNLSSIYSVDYLSINLHIEH